MYLLFVLYACAFHQSVADFLKLIFQENTPRINGDFAVGAWLILFGGLKHVPA